MRVLIIISICIAFLGGWLYFSARTPAGDNNQTSLTPEENANIDTAHSDGSVTKPDGTVILPSTNSSQPVEIPDATNTAPGGTAQYLTYSDQTFESAKEAIASTGGQLLLYFHIDWSSVCQELDPDIAASLDEFPANLTILKTDFEKDLAVRETYGVIHEHTFVQVGAQGEKITAWGSGSDAGDIPNHLQ